METATKRDVILLRLDHGEDILESIRSCTESELSTVAITAGLGMISEFELGYFDRGEYLSQFFEEAHELLSMQGSVSSDGDPRIHVHVTVADKSHRSFGGHLLRGKAWMSNEILMTRMTGLRSIRKVDPDKGVGVLHLVDGMASTD